MSRRPKKHPPEGTLDSFGPRSHSIHLRINKRELATILAALRYHQDENLQGSEAIPDQQVNEIATDGGALEPLSFDEVGDLCERLNLDADRWEGRIIAPPPQETQGQPLFRVVYTIDLNANSPLQAARQAYQILTSPDSQLPVLDVIDHRGRVRRIDLAKRRRSRPNGGRR